MSDLLISYTLNLIDPRKEKKMTGAHFTNNIPNDVGIPDFTKLQTCGLLIALGVHLQMQIKERRNAGVYLSCGLHVSVCSPSFGGQPTYVDMGKCALTYIYFMIRNHHFHWIFPYYPLYTSLIIIIHPMVSPISKLLMLNSS